ncbi:MAG: hypothetical protein CMP56_00225 [Flavobacteriales bacterium]|nr:hypothetical protein [Flavobacteriales bacterium]|tara:strand:- start:485 stop:1189 length:705 start_codon:yes stop_codon:yes gene_type:complete
MRKFIVLLILPIIGFSQCENPILDKILQDSNVNQYFQLAVSLNIAELQFLNDCNTDVNYTMFVPGNDLPNESASLLLGLGGELVDYISYYTHPESIEFLDFTSSDIEMLDGNIANISVNQSVDNYNVMINQANITIQDICACNGVIHIIDDLIWAPGVISLNERACVNQQENLLNFSKIKNKGVLEIRDINGKIILNKIVDNTTTINTSNYKTGIYIVQLQTPDQNLRELFFIN